MLKYKYLEEVEYSEIDFTLYDDLGIAEYDMEHIDDCLDVKLDFDENYKGNYNQESAPINIDVLIHQLNKMKDSGANYVEIVYHEDHIGYVINSLKIDYE